MAQFVNASISVEGKSIKQFSSLSLTQGIFDHHAFKLVCPTESIDGTSSNVFNSSKDWIGGSISIQISAVGTDGKLQFTGVITQIESTRSSGHAGNLVISGFSPTILLDSGPHCKTWAKKTIKNIAQDVVQHFPQNLLQPKISPTFGDALSYSVQYKETAWQFLCRLSATYGEWIFYDGQKLQLGAPQGGNTKLTYGSNLQSFNMAMQVRPAKFDVMARDYMHNEIYESQPSGISSKAGLNDFGKLALQKSEDFYGTQPKFWHNAFLTSKKQLDDYVTARASIQASNMVLFNGTSDHPGVQLVGTVSVQGKNVFDQSDESFGDYVVVSLTHHCDGQGNYSNSFISVPSTVKMPPVSVYAEPNCETQSALVTDNNDQDGLGRVRVQFHWMNSDEKSPWLRIASPHGGDGKGMFFIPEVGEEVIVGFEAGSPTKPYVIGTVYHGKAKTDFSNEGNDLKVLRTRTGIRMLMNDKEGSISIVDKGDNNIKIDGDGNITITANESIALNCGNAQIQMQKDGTIDIKGKQITTNATEKVTMESGQASFIADGTQNSTTVDGVQVVVNGQESVDITSVEVGVSGETKADVSAAQVSIGGQAMVQVQAPMITLN